MKIKLMLIIMFVLAGLVVPSWAVFPTVGVYDPNDAPWYNNVDQSGTFVSGTGGATATNILVLADIQLGGAYDIAVEYAANTGGVVDFEGTGNPNLIGQTIRAIYGTSATKTVDITGTSGTIKLEDGESSKGQRRPTSGNTRIAKDGGANFDFDLGGITGGDPGENVIVFGATVICREGEDVTPTVTATFSDGSTVTSTAPMPGDNANDEDSFFGFLAPEDTYIVSVNFNLNAYSHMDDIVFITGIIPTSIDAGPDQTVTLRDALTSTSVVLDSTLIAPLVGEIYTYSWSSVPSTGVVYLNGSQTAADPNITFATDDVYLFTLDLADGLGHVASDTVTVTVTPPVLDAGDDQTVTLEEALEDVVLNPTLTQRLEGEVYTFTWSCPSDGVEFPENGSPDPNVTFTTDGVYILTLNVTGTGSEPHNTDVSDTLSIFITGAAHWVGPTGGDWHATGPTNWTDPNGIALPVPDASMNVYLSDDAEPIGVEVVVNINAPANAYSIDVADDPNNPYTVNVNSGGSITTTGNLNIATDPTQTATVNLLAGAPLTIGGIVNVGDDGTGTLSALASSVIDITGNLNVGDEGIGIFNMTGGTLTVGADIKVSKNDNDGVEGRGTGDMTLNTVTVEVGSDIRVASDDSDDDGSGTGTLTLTDCDVIMEDDLRVGNYGTGTLTSTGGYIDVDDNIEIGSGGGGTGTVTLNSTNINGSVDDANARRLDVGYGGIGTLILNGTSIVETISDDTSIGRGTNDSGGSSIGTVELHDTSQLIIDDDDSNRSLRLGYSEQSIGTIVMNDTSYLEVDDDLKAGAKDTATVIITMTGGTFDVNDKTSLGGKANTDPHPNDNTGWVVGDNTSARLTMSGSSQFLSGDRIWFGTENDPDKFTDTATRNELKLSGNAYIECGEDIYIANNPGAYVYVEVNEQSEINSKKNFRVGYDGGGCDLTVNGGRLNVDDDLRIASSVVSPTTVSPVNITLENGALVDVENEIRIGGLGAQVTITVIDSLIDQEKSDESGGGMKMPYSGLSGATGYCHIILGKNVSGPSADSATLKIGGALDASNANSVKDYIDFLAGGLLIIDEISAQEVEAHIASGYFTTSYDQATLYGVPLATGGPGVAEEYAIVYEENDGNYEIELGIRLRPTMCVSPAGDITSDCIVDMNDIAALSAGWEDPYGMTELGNIATTWLDNGLVFGSLPTPNPATFDSVPAAVTDNTTITMTATEGYHPTEPIQYYFDETSGNTGGDDSGWQPETSYTDIGLSTGLTYTYTVTIRNATDLTEGDPSGPESAMAGIPPTPSPATFDSAPAATDGTTIIMTATAGSHANSVQYYFDETSGFAGADDSGWQTETSYTDTGLTAGFIYTYTVTMRDATGFIEGGTSGPESAVPSSEAYSITTSTSAPTTNVVAADSETGPATNATSMRNSTNSGSQNTDRGQKFTATTSYILDKITIQARDVVLAGAKGAGMSIELWNVTTSTLLNVSTGASTPPDLAVNDYITYDVIDTPLTAGTQYCFVVRFDSSAADREMDIARVDDEYSGGVVVTRTFGVGGTRPADGSLSVPPDDSGRDLVFYIQQE